MVCSPMVSPLTASGSRSRSAEDADDEDYLLVLASRVALALARLKWLDYQHVTDEDDLDVFTISLAQAGYPLLKAVEECYEFFDKKALLPIGGEEDIPDPGEERPCRRVGEGALEALEDEYLRVGPYKAVLAAEKNKVLEELRAKLDALSQVEREELGLSEALKERDREAPKERERSQRMQTWVLEWLRGCSR